MRVKLINLDLECDRHGVSDRCASSIASAVLQDIEIIHEGDSSKVIDRNQIRRHRKQVRNVLQSYRPNTSIVCGLFFDGRKDQTRMQVKKGKKYYPNIITEEHFTLVQEPDSEYLGHITTSAGDSKSIKKV